MNVVILSGNLASDVETRKVGDGQVSEFRMGVRHAYDKDKPLFVDVSVWGKTAEVAEKYLSKGSSVSIEGRLEMDQWEDKESGKKRSKLRIVGNRLELGAKGGNGGGGNGQPETVNANAGGQQDWSDF